MTHPLRIPNRFALGVFSANADGGLAITTVPDRWRASWDDNVAAAQLADEGGLDFLLPIARWQGFGGATRAREHAFETFTWASALAALTHRIAVFATVHVPLVHPVFAAKALATVDHVAHGRAGLNIVVGWQPGEFAMFGATPDARGYDRAREWLTIIERAYAENVPFDFAGEYYQLKGVVSRPAPVQRPRPLLMNAAFGGPGRDFAAARCDALFTTFTEIPDAAGHVADMRARAAAAGRDIQVYAVAHVVCRPSQAQAEDDYHRYAVAEADHEAVDQHMAGKQAHAASHDPAVFARHRQRFAGGAGSYPLIGNPAHIAHELEAMAAQGLSGVALSFLHYINELPYFIAETLPLLTHVGLRG